MTTLQFGIHSFQSSHFEFLYLELWISKYSYFKFHNINIRNFNIQLFTFSIQTINLRFRILTQKKDTIGIFTFLTITFKILTFLIFTFKILNHQILNCIILQYLSHGVMNSSLYWSGLQPVDTLWFILCVIVMQNLCEHVSQLMQDHLSLFFTWLCLFWSVRTVAGLQSNFLINLFLQSPLVSNGD